VTCIDQHGEAVDMFIIYKLPRIASDPGNNYVYLDSKDLTFGQGKDKINETSNPAAKTLEQVYAQYSNRHEGGSDNLAHIFYNDAPPYGRGYNFTFGHTKGQLAFDHETGFWIIQSVPRFPTRVSKGYGYPHSGFKYGQMMMCISFSAESFKDIGLQLKYTKPHIYDSNLPTKWESEYKHIYDVLKGSFIERKPSAKTVSLRSLQGVAYSHFGKNGQWHHDLYYNLVAPTLKTNLIVESWQHGHNNIGPSCKGKFTVVDASQVSINDKYTFRIYDDHSKYAISTDRSLPLVCVGDINRQYSQFKRGGGCICVKNIDLWKTFSSLISKAESCP